MVLLPNEKHLKDLVENTYEDSATDTTSACEDDEEKDQDDNSLAARNKENRRNGFSVQEVDANIGRYFPGNSHINVENSSDVVIGSLTQFNGPVTIVQNGNSKKIFALGNQEFITEDEKDIHNTSPTYPPNQPSSNSPLANQIHPSSPENNPFELFWTTKRRWLVIFIAIAVPLLIIAFSTILTLNHSHTILPPANNESSVTLKPLGKHLQITRGQWGGRPMLNNTRVLKHPTQYVLISHTAGVWCANFRTCSDAVQILQSLHVSTYGSPDIGYNFLIGGDANIYVGRGWDIRNFHTDNNIGISFIGNFVYDSLTPGMIEACQELLEEGVNTGKLAANYTLIGHNQTWPTQSPGDHVVAVLRTWAHWQDGDFLDI